MEWNYGRLFQRRADATGNALSPLADSRVCWTASDIDKAEYHRWSGSVSAGRRSSLDRYVGPRLC